MWSFDTDRWHSINLIPSVNVVSVVNDDRSEVGRMIEVTILGRVFRLTYPAKETRRARFTGLRGPLWSRKRRLVYWPSP